MILRATLLGALMGLGVCLAGVDSASSVTVQDHLLFAAVLDPEDLGLAPENRILNQLEVAADYHHWNLSAQITNNFFQGQPSGTGRLATIEKKLLSYSTKALRIDIGDFPQQLGRAIALDLYRDDTFGIHNTLEGISATYAIATVKSHLFGGRINAITTPLALLPVDDPLRDRTVSLMGGAIEARLSPDQAIDVHLFSALSSPTTDFGFTKRWHTVGASLSSTHPVFDADLYLETNALIRTRTLAGQTVQNPTGFASYASLTWSPPSWKIKLEGKDYRDYDFEFRRPPTLEESVVVSLNTESVTAARLQAERRLGFHSVSGSLLSGYDRLVNTPLHHAVAGARFRFGKRELEAKTGYRTLVGEGDLAHATLTVKLPTFTRQSLELAFRKLQEIKNQRTITTHEDRNGLETNYNFSERWTLGLGYEHIPTNTGEQQNHFLSATAAYKKGNITARAFIGETSGGSKCSGGVCRQIPPLSGALVEGYLTF